MWWDRGRPARKRAAGAQRFGSTSSNVFALRAHCGRDARGPSTSLELIDYLDSHLGAVRADLRDVHGGAQHRQRVERARTLSTHFVTQLPDTFRKMIDKDAR